MPSSIDRAEACLGQGDAPDDAIDRALRDHDQPAVKLETAARGVWRTMTVGEEPDPLARETLRETLDRLDLLGAVREEMRREFDAQPAAVRGLRVALCYSVTRDCPAMRKAIEGFHAYVSIVHDATGTRPAVRELAAALLVLAPTDGRRHG